MPDEEQENIIEDDDVYTALADDVIAERGTAPKPKPALQTVERGEDPSVFDAIQSLHDLIASYPGDKVSWVVSDRGLLEFAEKVWGAAYEQGTDDLAQCCGCSGGPTTPNPFKEQK